MDMVINNNESDYNLEGNLHDATLIAHVLKKGKLSSNNYS